MKRILNCVLAATLICGASVFTSCEKSDTVLSDKILGKWIVADLDGAACPTSWKSVRESVAILWGMDSRSLGATLVQLLLRPRLSAPYAAGGYFPASLLEHSEPPLVVSQLLERQDCLPVR